MTDPEYPKQIVGPVGGMELSLVGDTQPWSMNLNVAEGDPRHGSLDIANAVFSVCGKNASAAELVVWIGANYTIATEQALEVELTDTGPNRYVRYTKADFRLVPRSKYYGDGKPTRLESRP